MDSGRQLSGLKDDSLSFGDCKTEQGGAEYSGELGRGQDAEASEGWREPVYHCALTQSRKEQSQ